MNTVKCREAAPPGARERERKNMFRRFYDRSRVCQIARDARRGSSVAERTHEALAL